MNGNSELTGLLIMLPDKTYFIEGDPIAIAGQVDEALKAYGLVDDSNVIAPEEIVSFTGVEINQMLRQIITAVRGKRRPGGG